jgi:hypothetical protein
LRCEARQKLFKHHSGKLKMRPAVVLTEDTACCWSFCTVSAA